MVSPVAVEAAVHAPGSICSICEQFVSKYKCPGCQTPTCSLACCKQHKQQTGCSGKRDKLAFVPMQEFSDRHLMSDYRWLEEVNRVDDNAKRHRPPIPRRELPHHLSGLVHQARLRGVRLLIMPPGMQRRQTNSTRYDPRTRKLYWRLEWRFPAAAAGPQPLPAAAAADAAGDEATPIVEQHPQPQQQPQQQQQQQQQAGRVIVFDGKIDDQALLETVLGRHLMYRQGQGAQALQLRAYREVGAQGLTVLMRKERCPANAVRFYRLDTSQSLSSQLSGKLVIEYPTLLVLLPGDDSSYDIISPEEQQAEQQARQGGYHQGFRQQQQQQQGPPGGGYPWPPPPPPPPRATKPEAQQQQQQGPQSEQQQVDQTGTAQQQKQQQDADQQEPQAKRQCTAAAAAATAAAAAADSGNKGSDQPADTQPGAVGQQQGDPSSQPLQQQQPGQQQQQQLAPPPPPQQQQQQQQPKYYYYDPTAGMDEDAECLAGLADDLDEDDVVGATRPPGAAAAAAAAAKAGATQQQAVGSSSSGDALRGGQAMMMQLLGQYHDENEIDIDDAED